MSYNADEVIPPQLIQDALQRVIGSREFVNSERKRRFLNFIVQETLAGHADRIKAYTIAIDASLNHTPNRRQVLRECRRLIRPDGQLVVTMLPPRLSQAWHFVRSPWDADQVERGMQPGEVYGLTRDQTDELLLEARFAPIMHRRFMLGLNLLTLARPALTEVVRRRIRTNRPVRATEVLGQPVAARTAESGVRPVPALGATAEG